MGHTYRNQKENEIMDDYVNLVVMNKSNHSYLSNRKITENFNSNSWLDQRCFIVGGGESLRGFDFNTLKNEHTIGINKAFQHYDFTINYAMDSDLYEGLKEGRWDELEKTQLWNKWNDFKGTRVFLTPHFYENRSISLLYSIASATKE